MYSASRRAKPPGHRRESTLGLRLAHPLRLTTASARSHGEPRPVNGDLPHCLHQAAFDAAGVRSANARVRLATALAKRTTCGAASVVLDAASTWLASSVICRCWTACAKPSTYDASTACPAAIRRNRFLASEAMVSADASAAALSHGPSPPGPAFLLHSSAVAASASAAPTTVRTSRSGKRGSGGAAALEGLPAL